MCSLPPCSFSPSHSCQIKFHTLGVGWGGEGWGWGFQSQGTGLKESKRGVVHISKSIQKWCRYNANISQHFNNVSDWVWYSVSCHQQGGRTTRACSPRASMDSVKVQTGTLDIYVCIYIYICICVYIYRYKYSRRWGLSSFSLSSFHVSRVHFGKGWQSLRDAASICPLPFLFRQTGLAWYLTEV